MKLQYFLTLLSCMVVSVVSKTRAKGSVSVGDRRVGWTRKPLAIGALSGFRFWPEPYLLEFHGANCDHCEEMEPFMKKLAKRYRLLIKRHLVWEGTANFRLMSLYDMETQCQGLPFFYNRRTNRTICGATTWKNFLGWAMCMDSQTFLPPTLTAEQEEDLKPKKIKQDSMFEKLKAKAKGQQKALPKVEGYDE